MRLWVIDSPLFVVGHEGAIEGGCFIGRIDKGERGSIDQRAEGAVKTGVEK